MKCWRELTAFLRCDSGRSIAMSGSEGSGWSPPRGGHWEFIPLGGRKKGNNRSRDEGEGCFFGGGDGEGQGGQGGTVCCCWQARSLPPQPSNFVSGLVFVFLW